MIGTTQLMNLKGVAKDAANKYTGMELFDTKIQVLNKLEITFIDQELRDGKDEKDKDYVFQYNPNSLKITKGAKWSESDGVAKDAKKKQFESGEARIITIGNILFDTTTTGGEKGMESVYANYIEPLESMAMVRLFGEGEAAVPRPPILRLSWGKADYLAFNCVLTSVEYTLKMFNKDGTPIRAEVDLVFGEYPLDTDEAITHKKQDVVKKYEVQLGDTLHTIATAQYKDPNKWKSIATANGIDDPHFIPAGTELIIPKF